MENITGIRRVSAHGCYYAIDNDTGDLVFKAMLTDGTIEKDVDWTVVEQLDTIEQIELINKLYGTAFTLDTVSFNVQ